MSRAPPDAMPPAEATSPAFLYRAYGLVIGSELALPELRPAPAGAGSPAVSIRVAPLPEIADAQGPPDARRLGPFLWAASGRFWFRVPGIVAFRIADGREIVVDPDPAGDADGVRTFLLGTALGVLLTQRGRLVLHGNAVRIGGGCVVCAGPSGAGKSTLAAGFLRRGFALLADDLVAVDAAAGVAPGIPRVKLWGDVARMLAIDTAPLRRIRSDLEKFHCPADAGFADTPAPLRAIYSLVVTNRDAVALERLTAHARWREVRAVAYRPAIAEATGGRAAQFARCTRLAAAVPVARLLRPARGFSVDALIDAILADLDAPA